MEKEEEEKEEQIKQLTLGKPTKPHSQHMAHGILVAIKIIIEDRAMDHINGPEGGSPGLEHLDHGLVRPVEVANLCRGKVGQQESLGI